MGSMDVDAADMFLTAEELAVRRRVRERLRNWDAPDGPPQGGRAADAGRLLEDLGLAPPVAVGPMAAALAVEEISRVSPELGRALVAGGAVPWPGASDRAAAETAWSLGAAGAACEACLERVRGAGMFDSTLMGHREAQVALGELVTDLQAARLGAFRAVRLIERGESVRGRGELERAAALASRTREAALALAAALPGPSDRPEIERSRR